MYFEFVSTKSIRRIPKLSKLMHANLPITIIWFVPKPLNFKRTRHFAARGGAKKIPVTNDLLDITDGGTQKYRNRGLSHNQVKKN